MEITVDSGAEESCMPTSWYADYPIDTSDSRMGSFYATASGEPLVNGGQNALNLATTGRANRRMAFQLTGVDNALGSVNMMARAKHWAVFGEDGSYTENKITGEVNAIREEDNTYVMDVFVVPYEHSMMRTVKPTSNEATFAGHCGAR